MTFESLFELYDWIPIRDCPGRFMLSNVIKPPPNWKDLLHEDEKILRFSPDACPDHVLIAMLDGEGALLTYEKQDGTQLHTLNTQSGFERKIDQLGIDIDQPD